MEKTFTFREAIGFFFFRLELLNLLSDGGKTLKY